MEKEKHILKLGLIGNNISHSQSPSIFKKAHPDWIYDLIDITDFEKGYNIFIQKNYDAVNITAPFKTEAFKKANTADIVCELIGASNLLIKEKNLESKEIIKAYNTDVLGATTCLKAILKSLHNFDIPYSSENEKEIASKYRVLNIGLGGAGKAATVASLMMGFETTCINRSTQTTIDFKARLEKGVEREDRKYNLTNLEIDDIERDGFSLRKIISEHDIIIYSLPLSLPFIEKIDFSEKAVIEANYHNPSFPKVKCNKYIGGEVWLHAQAQPLLSMNI